MNNSIIAARKLTDVDTVASNKGVTPKKTFARPALVLAGVFGLYIT